MSDYRTSYVRDLHTMAQVVHQAIGMALAGAGDWRALLDEALASMSTLFSDTAENRDDGLQLVAWHWSTEHGYCHDCGCPAAFWSDRYGRGSTVPQDDEKLCAVCAASAATKGETIQRIEPEHDDSLCGETQCSCPCFECQ